MAVSSRDPREYWLKTHFLKNEVANSGLELSVLDFPAAHLRWIKCVLRLILSRRFAII